MDSIPNRTNRQTASAAAMLRDSGEGGLGINISVHDSNGDDSKLLSEPGCSKGKEEPSNHHDVFSAPFLTYLKVELINIRLQDTEAKRRQGTVQEAWLLQRQGRD